MVQEKISKENYKDVIGKTFRVLCEGEGREDGFMAGRTDSNMVIEFKGDNTLYGKYLDVKVTELTNVLKGTII